MIWSTVKRYVGIALAAAGAVFLAMVYRKGYNDRQALQDKADAKAAQTVQKERTAARSASDEELNAKVDKWSRH